jgi:hypothetical protein
VSRRSESPIPGSGATTPKPVSRPIPTPLTAKTHVNRAMLKLDARDRAQLVVIACEVGIVRAGRA